MNIENLMWAPSSAKYSIYPLFPTLFSTILYSTPSTTSYIFGFTYVQQVVCIVYKVPLYLCCHSALEKVSDRYFAGKNNVSQTRSAALYCFE